MIPEAAAQRPGLRRGPNVRRLVSLGLPLLAAAATAWIAVTVLQGKPPPAQPSLSPADFTEATGIEVIRVALIAGGGAVDLRYHVVDAEKAAGAHSGGPTPIAVVDEGSGTVLRTGFSHYGQESGGGMHRAGMDYRPARTYFHLLTNSEGLLERGDRVTVVFGHARLADVVVQ
jgi:hypothetical protein